MLQLIFLYTFNVALENRSVLNNPSVGEGVPLADFWMLYMLLFAHYGFKICMLLKYNLLLGITLITFQLNIFVFVFIKPHAF